MQRFQFLGVSSDLRARHGHTGSSGRLDLSHQLNFILPALMFGPRRTRRAAGCRRWPRCPCRKWLPCGPGTQQVRCAASSHVQKAEESQVPSWQVQRAASNAAIALRSPSAAWKGWPEGPAPRLAAESSTRLGAAQPRVSSCAGGALKKASVSGHIALSEKARHRLEWL